MSMVHSTVQGCPDRPRGLQPPDVAPHGGGQTQGLLAEPGLQSTSQPAGLIPCSTGGDVALPSTNMALSPFTHSSGGCHRHA